MGFNYEITLQDAQDLGISIELLPLSSPDEKFNVSIFYAVSPFPLFLLHNLCELSILQTIIVLNSLL